MHYLDGSAQLMADTAFGEYIFLYHGELSIRKTFIRKMFEFEFLVSACSGAYRNFGELGISDGIFPGTRGAWPAILYSPDTGKLATRIEQVPVENAQWRAIGELYILVGSADKFFQMIFIDIGYFWNQHEWCAPAGAIDIIISHQELVFCCGADSALDRNAYGVRFIGRYAAAGGKSFDIDGVEFFGKLGLFLFELFQDRAHQLAFCGKSMSATIKT